MSSRLLLFSLLLAAPELHFNHPDYQTEWWYYTGNLWSSDGHRYGYELTFFRQTNQDAPTSDSVWNLHNLYLAHLALSDVDSLHFEHFERLNRAGPGLAGIDFTSRRYWNGNWSVQWKSDAGDQQLEAVSPDFTLRLNLRPAKKFVINGIDGVSRKGPATNEFSRYISFTRLLSQGNLLRNGTNIPLSGSSWMDHEFFNDTDDPTLQGWDWFAVQLDNNQELMLYRLRLKSGAVSPYSSGTFIESNGEAHNLKAPEFTLTLEATWTSPASKATYPIAWHLSIPSLNIELSETARLKQQELYTKDSISPAYWEGAVDYRGTESGQPVKGVGYLEMTGYSEPLRYGH